MEWNSYFSLWCDEEFFSCYYTGKFKCWLIWRFKAYPVLTHSIWFGLGADLFPKAWLNNNLHSLIWKQGDVDLWGVLHQCQHNIFCSLKLMNTKCFKFHFPSSKKHFYCCQTKEYLVPYNVMAWREGEEKSPWTKKISDQWLFLN